MYTKPKDDKFTQSMNQSKSRRQNNEVEENESAFLCNICFCKEPDAIFMECGHGGLCMSCAYDIWNVSDECFLCRESVNYIIRYDAKDKRGDLFKVLEVHQECSF